MVPIETHTTNIIFRAPGLPDLPATQAILRDRHPVTGEIAELSRFETCWSLTPEEIEEISRTGRIYVDMVIPALPAMCVSAHSFTESMDEEWHDGRQE